MGLGLDDDELKSVEQILSRLAQLSSSIQSLKMDILKSNPLPHPCSSPMGTQRISSQPLSDAHPSASPTNSDSLHASARILQRNLSTVLDCLSENAELFSRVAVRPSTNYPGRAQENVLTQLLRKKLEPDVEELVEGGREAARRATPEGVAELQAIWDELRAWTQSRIAEYVRDEAGDVYTKEERAMGVEKVRTGLRREIEEDDDEEDEDEDEDDDDDDNRDGTAAAAGANEVAALPPRGPEIETLLWFMTRADFDVARNVEYERKGAVLMRGLEGVNIPPARTDSVQPGASASHRMQL